MQKIFFIMSTDDYSGAEAVNFSIIDNLKDKYDFYWVSKKGNINNFLKEKNIKWIEINKLNVKEIKRIVRDYRPNILHATDFKASVICSLANTKIPLIEHLHNNCPWLKKLGLNSILFLFAGLKANKILTVSASIEKEYIFSNFIKDKMMCIGNPVSRNKVLSKVDNDDYNKKYDICCVARLTEQKNPLKFINIIEKLKNNFPKIRVVWVGKGELEDECKITIDKKNLNNTIKFVGFQKNPYKYMAQSKMFMLTSDWEGFGLVAFEAMTLGLPCVVSNVGGLNMMVDKSCGKLCTNENDFIEEAKILLTNEEIYKKKATAAIKKSKNIDNVVNYMNKLSEIYDQVSKGV